MNCCLFGPEITTGSVFTMENNVLEVVLNDLCQYFVDVYFEMCKGVGVNNI